jgi:hypothetical protein
MILSKEEIEQKTNALKKFGANNHHSFAYLTLLNEYKVLENEILDCIIFDKKSKGFNAFYLDRARKNLYLFYFCYTEQIKNLKEPIQFINQSELSFIFGDVKEVPDHLSTLKSLLVENTDSINRVYFNFYTNVESDKLHNSETLNSLREDLESKKYTIDNFFQSKKVSLIIDFLSNKNKKRSFHITNKSNSFSIHFSNFIEKQNTTNHRLLLGYIKLLDIYNLYLQMGSRLFDKNIRSGLSPENGPNKSIRKSLKSILNSQEDPNDFCFHHNGITISASNVEIQNGKILLIEPRILNGAQTITSFVKFIEENGKVNPEDNKGVKSIEVLGKIIIPDKNSNPNEFISSVTINTNRQNPVEPWNLRASDLIQLEFSDKFKDDLGIFYERQENSFDSMSLEELDELGIQQDKTILIKKLAQTFLALQGEIDKINKLREIFEDEKKYNNTFKNKYIESDSKKIVLIYKIQFRLGSIVKSLVENSSEKYSFIFQKSKNLIWSLLIQGLLNDKSFENNVNLFGSSLTSEVEFTEYMKNLAQKKVKPVLLDLYRDEKYQKAIEENKITFLKTKSIFDHCMKLANEKFNWQKQEL